MPQQFELPLGDRHQGKQTRLLRDADGSRIFKPRGAGTERRWSALLAALRDAGLRELPGCVELLTEEADVHTEAVVEHRPAAFESLPLYYRRCGVLLFLAWLCGAADLHAENLIADGDTPVPVDLETLFSGVEARTPDSALDSLAWSVYRCHLLPQFDGNTDISGFSGSSAAGRNLPLVLEAEDRKALSPPEISAWIREGFTEGYRFAEGHRALLAEQLQGFGGCRFRVILRPTEVYAKMIELLARLPEEQREPYAAALILPAYRRDVDPDRVRKAEAVIRAETAALTRGDVPLFTVRGDGLDLLCGDETVLRGYLRLSPVACALRRLDRLSESELLRQRKLIDLSYEALRPLTEAAQTKTGDAAAVLSEAALLTALTEELDRCVVPGHPSAFIRLTVSGAGKGFFQSAGWGLYDGLAGILCAYAAVLRRTGAASLRERILTLYKPLAERLLTGGPIPVTDAACALGDGLGGIIACLLHLSELTGLPRFAADAELLAARLDPTRSTARSTDLLNGAGGLCLQLPKLPKALALPLAKALLPLFRDCEPTLCGLAHGAAGQALCLGALQRVLPDEELRAPILRLLRWEDERFQPEIGNWPDLRNGKQTDFKGGWCSGAPGVGLARMRLAAYVDDPEIAAHCRRDVELAKLWLDRSDPAGRNVLCCGNGARLLAAARLGAEVLRWLGPVLETARADDPRLFHPLNTADRNPGLMQGLAGVIYVLALRDDQLCGALLL